MIDSPLGPLVAVASRGGSAPAKGAANDFAATGSHADDGRFTAALHSRRNPHSSDAHRAEAHTRKHAAGPQTGELHEEDAAEAGASQDTNTAADDLATAIAVAISVAVPVTTSPTAPAGALAGQLVAEVAPPQPVAGLVAAQLDGATGVTPVVTGAQAQAQAATATTATGTPAGGAPGAPLAGATTAATAATATAAAATAQAVASVAPADGGPAAAPSPDAATPAPVAPAATATLTLTIATVPGQDASVDAGTPAVAGADATAAVLGAKDVRTGVPLSVALAHDAPKATTTAEPPAGTVAPPPVAQPAPVDSLGGIVRSSGGLTTPHELAREIGSRVHMAVREGGRELVVNLRPAELGHLTIRVTINDGVMQAQIIADRPEAARMLQSSLGQLDSALGDLGYSLDNLDVAYQGRDSHDAQSSSHQATPAVRGEVLEADGSPAVSGSSTSSTASGSPARLDILA